MRSSRTNIISKTIKEDVSAIVLAGGKGTRLQGEIGKATPKVMALIGGEPFVDHLLGGLEKLGLRRVILALGHLADEVKSHVNSTYKGNLEITYSVENQPLGTGGAVSLASEKLECRYGLIMNGDTLVQIPLSKMLTTIEERSDFFAVALLAPCSKKNSGTSVRVEGSTIKALGEENAGPSEIVYSGVTLCEATHLSAKKGHHFPVGFEDLYLHELQKKEKLGAVFTSQFLDYGTPDGYREANE